MKKTDNRKIIAIIAAVVLNVVAIFAVIFSVVSAINDAENSSFKQNVENIRTLTDSSANKIELAIKHYTDTALTQASYINQYNGNGMTEEEIKTYFETVNYTQDYNWQLVEEHLRKVESAAKKNFSGISLNKTEMGSLLNYKINSYPELAQILCLPSKETLGNHYYTNEFTDPFSLEKSFAVIVPVRVKEYDESTDEKYYSYRSLMLLIRSSYINEMIANNNSTSNITFFNFSNIIMNYKGDYVISNEYFQGTNFLDYIETYNSEVTKQEKKSMQRLFEDKNITLHPLFYKNNKGEECIYTLSSIQNIDWYILSVVPVETFHNAYNFSWGFVNFFLSFTFLFLIDFAIMILVNRQLRIKTKEAEEANRAKSEFLSSMSHDIRTPMNAIIGLTVIAKKQLEEEPLNKEALSDSLRTIELSGNHLTTLVNDVLDITKIESGKVALHSNDFSIVHTVRKIIEMEASHIQEKEFVFETNIGELQHEYVHTDELRINQIFINILSNAIKYTNPGGKIVVDLSEEETASPESSRYIYRVTDTGIGMAPEFVKHIFDRFSRAVDTRINEVQGSGLGMAIVKQLVDLLGGKVEVTSKVDEGSTFTVTLELPVAVYKEKKPQIDMLESSKTKRPKIKLGQLREIFSDIKVLIVEDNDLNWTVISRILEFYSVIPDRADNGRMAVEMVENSEVPYDLIFMDIQMPIMNGYEATKVIRELEDKQRASIPIYAMTADTFAENVKMCTDVGMNGHLSKPIEVEKVLNIIRELEKGK